MSTDDQARACRKCKRLYAPSAGDIKRRRYICRECEMVRKRLANEVRKEAGLPIDPSSREKIVARRRRYRENEAVKARRNAQMKRYQRDPVLSVRHKARDIARKSVRSGLIARYACKNCGNVKAEMHHEDYAKPLEVVWLCRTCHYQHHHPTVSSGR